MGANSKSVITGRYYADRPAPPAQVGLLDAINISPMGSRHPKSATSRIATWCGHALVQRIVRALRVAKRSSQELPLALGEAIRVGPPAPRRPAAGAGAASGRSRSNRRRGCAQRVDWESLVPNRDLGHPFIYCSWTHAPPAPHGILCGLDDRATRRFQLVPELPEKAYRWPGCEAGGLPGSRNPAGRPANQLFGSHLAYNISSHSFMRDAMM